MPKHTYINMNKELKVKGGVLLVAEPFMTDGFFNRTVVLICEHNRSSSFGFVLNKRLDLNINDLVDDFPDFDCPVFCGGPVQNDNMYFLHTLGDLIPDSTEISPGIYWGGDFLELRKLVDLQMVTKNDVRFYVGYAGWDADQIVQEMKDNSWIITEPDPTFVFTDKIEDELWRHVLDNKGNTYSVISRIPNGLSWN
jgi:putative transcriptional regulator